MPDRVSLIDQYDNRDVIAQIYRIINIAKHGAIETLVATKEGSSVKLIFTMHDGTKHEITFESNGVKDVYAVQSGSTETVHVVLDDDTDKTFTFDIAIAGVTTDTQQTITARKTFTAPQTFSGGIEGTTMIDGDVQVSNGHSLSVAGDIDTAGDMQVAGNAEFLGNVEAGGMAIEESNGRTVLSNPNGVTMVGQFKLDAMTVAGMTISKSEDRATILDNDDPIIVPHTLEVATNLTGTRDSQAVNGIRLQNDLDNYGPMARLVNTQTFEAPQTFKSIKARSSNYSLYQTINEAVTATGVTAPNASGTQFFGGDETYLGRSAEVYDENTKRVSYDLRINSIINNGTHARLFMEEKEDGTFALSFWNGTTWNRLVQ